LPSPDAAAAAADFAVGDEAQHDGASPQAAAAAAELRLGQPQQQPPQTAATAVYRRLLSFNSLWGGSTSPSEQQQQQGQQQHQQHQEEEQISAVAGRPCACSLQARRRGQSAFAELQYNVYSLADYDPVWEHYAYIYPVWVGDFGKNNMSASINMSREAQVGLCCVCA
jgi:hypothetical protein